MGCDYYADERGIFEIEFRSETGKKGFVMLTDLKPKEKIYMELNTGESR